MAEEIELKLALAEDQAARFLRQPLLKQAQRRRAENLDNIYYDTADLALRRNGIALRLRRQGGSWRQTVKLAGSAAGGLSNRPEWETPYAGHFDFSGLPLVSLRDWLQRPQRLARIEPICETRFRRITWTFAIGGGHVLLTLDRGWIVAHGRREAICEVEIELAGAPLHALFELAAQLGRQVALAPSVLSKAERGIRLYLGHAQAPFKSVSPPLTAAMSPATAFRAIALSCLDHLQLNHAGALASDDPEYIHQMRVACRRLRAALRLFRPVVAEPVAQALRAPLSVLMEPLGRARDLDVLLEEIANPVLRALPGEPRLPALASDITNRRYLARAQALALLAAPGYGHSLLAALEALHGMSAAEDGAGALLDFATQRLHRLRRKLRRLAGAASSDAPASLHALRIGVKRLRYALEFFAPLADNAALRRDLRQLAAAQDRLGQLNDLANAGALLTECAGSDPGLREAVTLIGGWHAQRYAALLAAIESERTGLMRLRLPRLAQRREPARKTRQWT